MSVIKMIAIFLCLAFTISGNVHAHKPSDAFMTIESTPVAQKVNVRLSLALKDIDAAIETLDENNDRQLTFAELKKSRVEIENLVGKEVVVQCGSNSTSVTWQFDQSQDVSPLEKRNDGTYVRLKAEVSCASASSLQLQYRLFEDIDMSHRLLISNLLGVTESVSVASPSNNFVLLRNGGNVKEAASAVATVMNFIIEGFTHLAIGWDHLAFILVLVLPFMLWKKNQAAYDFDWHSGKRLLYVISAFTVGHCVTLVLVALNIITVTGQWVEPTIALTIVISAALNLMPEVKAPRVWMPLIFGTIHGLGFSSVLSELEISAGSRLLALVGFNLGIELGQIVFVALWAALQYGLVRLQGYARWVVTGGSIVLMVAAVMLTIVRASS
jgi:HupE / UreJ protein